MGDWERLKHGWVESRDGMRNASTYNNVIIVHFCVAVFFCEHDRLCRGISLHRVIFVI